MTNWFVASARTAAFTSRRERTTTIHSVVTLVVAATSEVSSVPKSGTELEEVTQIVSNGGRDTDGSPRMLSRWTFQYTPARTFVEEHLAGRVLNACAGKTTLNHDGEVHRNDLNPERDAETHHDVAEVADHFEPQSFDTVVFDPPFDEKQAETKYDGLHAMDVYAALEGFEELVRPGGRVICFGWNSWGMRSFSAFERVETVLFQRGPIHRDVICTVDERTSHSLASDGGQWSLNSASEQDQEVDRDV
jgi:hypothetical protein